MGWLIKENRDFATLDMMEKYAKDLIGIASTVERTRGIAGCSTGRVMWCYWRRSSPRWHFWFRRRRPRRFDSASAFSFGGDCSDGVCLAHHLGGQLRQPCLGLSELHHRRRQHQQLGGGLLTNGEGWHNNHHADQRSASHGHRWWEIDLTHWTIKGLQAVGLVWDVLPPRVPKQRLSETKVAE